MVLKYRYGVVWCGVILVITQGVRDQVVRSFLVLLLHPLFFGLEKRKPKSPL